MMTHRYSFLISIIITSITLASPRYVQELQTILGPQNPLRKAVSVKARDPVGSEIYRNTSRNCKIMYCNFSVLYCTNKALRTYGRDTQTFLHQVLKINYYWQKYLIPRDLVNHLTHKFGHVELLNEHGKVIIVLKAKIHVV